MPREYVVTMEQISVTAVQDLFQIKGASGKIVRIKEVTLVDVDGTLPTNQQMALRMRFLPATVTDGNGTSVTPQKTDPGDAAASLTALRNSTSKATTNGTAVTVREDGANLYAGYSYAWPPADRPVIGPSESFVFELLTAPVSSGTWVMNGTVTVEEFGG